MLIMIILEKICKKRACIIHYRIFILKTHVTVLMIKHAHFIFNQKLFNLCLLARRECRKCFDNINQSLEEDTVYLTVWAS